MKFIFKNIGMIHSGEVELEGITLIAGENSSGKSTIEKAVSLCLASLFNLSEFVQIDRAATAISDFRKYGVTLDDILKNITSAKRRHRVSEIEKLQEKYAIKIVQTLPLGRKKLETIIDEYAVQHASFYGAARKELLHTTEYSQWKRGIVDDLYRDISSSDDEIGRSSVTEYIRQFFDGQIISFGLEGEKSFIEHIDDNGHSNIMNFERQPKNARDVCSDLKVKMSVLNPCVYIDSPEIFDDLNAEDEDSIRRSIRQMLAPGGKRYRFTSKDTWNVIAQEYSDQYGQTSMTAIQREQNQKVVDEFNGMIDNVIHGHLKATTSGRLQFVSDMGGRAVEMRNLSTGIKSFSVLSYAIEHGCIGEGSYILLDEPEINLHPAWQIKYAELLIQMRRELNVKIILTTHSPYFVMAIEDLAKKYSIHNDCRFYMTEATSNGAVIKDVSKDIRPIYDRLAKPFEYLDNIEGEF